MCSEFVSSLVSRLVIVGIYDFLFFIGFSGFVVNFGVK